MLPILFFIFLKSANRRFFCYANSMQTIGIDIGGSKIRAVLWNGKKVQATRQIKTPKTLALFKKEIIKISTWMSSTQVDGIGIAAPSIISGNKITKSPNIKYLKNFDFRSLGSLASKLKLDSDARCFARAELSAFATSTIEGRGTILFITLGTGVGRAVAKNGKVQVIKKLEYPQHWEKEYQRLRGDFKANFDSHLAKFLAGKLMDFSKSYAVNSVVFGGGIVSRKNFISKMRKEFAALGARFKIASAKYGKNSVAIGAAKLF